MTANSTTFADAAVAPDESGEKTGTSSLSLAQMAIGDEAIVCELALESELAAWLRAVGIGEGDTVSVLRAGAFGGPLHVRNSVGGEFALNRQLAKSILVKRT
jgi:Fe2+ transport system protein FeoA